MGYCTELSGDFFGLDKPLSPEHKVYLEKFSDSRRMKRDVEILVDRLKPILDSAGLPLGEEGAYFVDVPYEHDEEMSDPSIVYPSSPPKGQPSFWCRWVPSEDGRKIVWCESERFNGYILWLEYIINHFLKPWGYTINGSCSWQGEEMDDYGTITVENNIVKVVGQKAVTGYSIISWYPAA